MVERKLQKILANRRIRGNNRNPKNVLSQPAQNTRDRTGLGSNPSLRNYKDSKKKNKNYKLLP